MYLKGELALVINLMKTIGGLPTWLGKRLFASLMKGPTLQKST